MKILHLFILVCCVIVIHGNGNVFKMHRNIEDLNKFSSENHAGRSKRSATGTCEIDNSQEILKKHTNEHAFANDTNPSIAMVWSGKNGVVLVLTMSKVVALQVPSYLYRSEDFGRTYKNISEHIGSSVIEPTYGVHTSSVDTSLVMFIVAPPTFVYDSNTVIYMSRDSCAHTDRIVCPFQMQTSTISYNKFKAESILVLSTIRSNSELWLSTNFGRSWRKVASFVTQFRWDGKDEERFYYTIDPTHKMLGDGFYNEFYGCNVNSYHNPEMLAEHVYAFGIQQQFIFISIEFRAHNGSRVVHISKNQGKTWDAAQLPLISPEQFYSILDMSEGMVMLHVDSPGESGYGTMYTSGSAGIIYDKSLDYHIYVKKGSVTDVFRADCLPGVYITSQFAPKTGNIQSVITFNKGGVWQPINAPEGSICTPNEISCDLQIHNQFSLSKRVMVAEFPKSHTQAPGIIMAHGNVGDGLTKLSNVFVTSDGGYSWIQPTELVGPQFYVIADSGGLLVSVNATGTTNTLSFSFDEGQCWQTYKFREKPVKITGLSVEPGNKAAEISLWGWEYDDTWWRAITINFEELMGRPCASFDYNVWTPHEVANPQNDDGCLLGQKLKYMRRKKGTVCVNGKTFENDVDYQTCTCTKSDYMCDYGYYREDGSVTCVPDPQKHQDICIHNEEEIETSMYRKIPGDKCVGGEQLQKPPKIIKKSCASAAEDVGVDKDKFHPYEEPHPTSSKLIFFVVILVICVIVLLGLLTFLLRRKYRRGHVRFTRIPDHDPDEESLHANGGTSLVVADDDVHEPISRQHSAYSNESDEDLLIT